MVIQKPGRRPRRGTVAVETALVMVAVTSLLFGVFEFSRLFMDWNLLNNAAREGCRFAIVHNTDTAITTEVQTTVTTYMSGQTTSFSNFAVTVSGTHLGVATPINNLTAGDLVTVSVSGTYHFLNIIPFVKLPASFTITSSVIMGCEGGV
jgi:Flp pilus assembly protein TadG